MTYDFSRLVESINQYLRCEIAGPETARAIDEFVSSDKVYDLPEELTSIALELQNQVAMYVSSPEKRAEYSGYLGDSELKEILIRFLSRIRN